MVDVTVTGDTKVKSVTIVSDTSTSQLVAVPFSCHVMVASVPTILLTATLEGVAQYSLVEVMPSRMLGTKWVE